MRLTRRDALGALATLGAASIAGCSGDAGESDSGTTLDDERLRTLTAASVVLFPSEASGHEGFVREYVDGRTARRPTYREGLEEAADELDAVAREWHGGAFADLSVDERDRALRELGVETADSDPDGPLPERIRHYVVEELLYAFYASPVGGRLVGIENPVGYPGGVESYRRASMEDDGG
jgi:hypothetical protein